MTRVAAAGRALVMFGLMATGVLPIFRAVADTPYHSRAERIRRVESELLPITATRAHLGSYANLRERMRAYGVPGISIAVIDNGRIDWAKGYGFADIATRTPLTPDIALQAASISKPVAALGALILVERGKLGLDTDVNRYLREWKVPTNGMTEIHPVTLRTLLDHSAGLSEISGPDYRTGESAPTLLQIVEGVNRRVTVTP